MPLFFITAGFFIKLDLPFKEFLVKDFKRLMIPYFIFAPIGLILEILKRIALHRESLNYANEIKGIFFNMDMNSLINHYGFVLWFLPALFFARLILFSIQKLTTNLFYNFIIVLILFAMSFKLELPFAIDKAFNAALWVYSGFIFYNFYQERKLLYFLPCIPVLIFTFWGFPGLDMARKNYSNISLNIPWAFSVIYIFVIVFKKLEYSKNISNLLALWAGETMLLFIVHPYTNNIAHLMVEKIQFGDWFLKFFISLLLLYIVLMIKVKYKDRGIFKYV